MRVTANQVTLLRLLLLPVPVAMVYRGTREWQLAALAVYVLLGLTDAVDGMLARRHGSTPLGALLDPVVDKIFLVAAYGPLADFRIVPLALVSLLFVRELAVTGLRSVALEERFSFQTRLLAKLKTTVQMAGAGFILLLWLFDGRAIAVVLGVAVALAALPPLVVLARGRRPGWKSLSGAGLIAAVAAVRAALAAERAILAVLVVVVALTFWSGIEYAVDMRRVVAARVRRSPREGVRLVLLATAVPLALLPALERPGAPSFLVLAVLAAELAAGGLDNSLVQAGRPRGAAADLLRGSAQALLGAGVLVALAAPEPRLELAHLLAALALAVTLGDVAVRAWRHRPAFG